MHQLLAADKYQSVRKRLLHQHSAAKEVPLASRHTPACWDLYPAQSGRRHRSSSHAPGNPYESRQGRNRPTPRKCSWSDRIRLKQLLQRPQQYTSLPWNRRSLILRQKVFALSRLGSRRCSLSEVCLREFFHLGFWQHQMHAGADPNHARCNW